MRRKRFPTGTYSKTNSSFTDTETVSWSWPGKLAVLISASLLDNLFVVLVGWLLNITATCQGISRTNLLRQLYVLPH